MVLAIHGRVMGAELTYPVVLPRRANEAATQGYTICSQHFGEDLCTYPTPLYLLPFTLSPSRRSPPIMAEQIIKENMRLLAKPSDEEDFQFLTSSRHRARGFSFSSQYGTLRLLYLGVLHVVLVLFLLELLLQHFNYQRGLKSGIYSKNFTPYNTAYHRTKEE